jgi:hypothetical protein
LPVLCPLVRLWPVVRRWLVGAVPEGTGRACAFLAGQLLPLDRMDPRRGLIRIPFVPLRAPVRLTPSRRAQTGPPEGPAGLAAVGGLTPTERAAPAPATVLATGPVPSAAPVPVGRPTAAGSIQIANPAPSGGPTRVAGSGPIAGRILPVGPAWASGSIRVAGAGAVGFLAVIRRLAYLGESGTPSGLPGLAGVRLALPRPT